MFFFVAFLFISSVISLYSCSKLNKCFHSSGKIIKETRIISEFRRLRINSLMDVYWHFDTTNKIVIEAGENLMPFIETEVENNILSITDRNRCNWLRKYKRIQLHIYSKSLKYIDLYGNGDFTMIDTLVNDSVMVDNWSDISKVKLLVKSNVFSYSLNAGTGDTYIYGSANVCYLWVMGYGYVHAKDFKTAYNYITHKSTGNLTVNVFKETKNELFSLGNLYIYGKPYKVESHIYSSGKVIIAE